MHGWMRKIFKSRVTSSAQHEQEAHVPKKSVCSVSRESPSSISPCCSLSSSSSLGTAPSKPQLPHSAPSSRRWSRKYDVLVCNSSLQSDVEEAFRLVSFLEASPRSLRCFLMQRDACPGGAIATEFCQAVQNSHLRALLITPDFLQDGWCKYIMHQALAEGPMSNRIIPLLQNLSRSQCPPEVRFYYQIDLSSNPERGYTVVNKTVLNYLENLDKNQKTLDYSMDSSSNGAISSPKEREADTQVYDPAGMPTESDIEER
ncbi:toll/interleukin-1 receptor domain-containing adapter protein [Notothenia coriiceps]|uniref:Toll/interleukin-1 receptor domain-containing adapter protein n=1 Tax=Notothenia coriiceps TaxID=8208 RepID=A0A6I9MQN3_9TELE|nr:PREDICTED: toll/interleukin-1 receptor domain-containing adapter protein [Notothenia coriiceps]XP_010765569.1 PREDICTED: toll/interleukin-1 receptor domain-containing adapter protein [Notothenia coriiceps]